MFTMLCSNTNLKHGIVNGKSTKSGTMKPLQDVTQRQQVGVSNKCHGKIHQVYPKFQQLHQYTTFFG
jgi:hypothetical protein